MYKLSFFSFVFFYVLSISAQNQPTVKASVNKNQIIIGEPLLLTIEANYSANAAYSFFYIDTLPHFEFLEKPIIDTINKDGEIAIKGVYKLTSFDSGRWQIPSFSFSKHDNSLKTALIPIDVVFAPFNSNQNYHDIKEIENTEPHTKPFNWWYVIIGIVAAALLLYLIKKRKKPTAKSVATENAYQQAIAHLEQLRKRRLDTKEYYAGITDIFRQYVFQRKQIKSLQKTTGDLLLQLQQLSLPKEQYSKLQSALSLCDAVKFAKYTPSIEDDEMVYLDILNSIKAIELTQIKANTD